MSRRGISICLILTALFAVGCADSAQRAGISGVATASSVKVTVTPWAFAGTPGRTLASQHYNIHTTISDPEILEKLPVLMEGAYLQYQHLTPGVPESDHPMECYIFNRRAEWAAFTKERTGNDAGTYLRINRGGYTIRDWYVAFDIGEPGTYYVAAHEGWHQYVARNFRSRLPPFLEEGLATMFENVNVNVAGAMPHWNLAINYNRADKLKSAIDENELWPLDQLCVMHAGNVVGLSGDRIEAFYAQDWAFAQFMLSAENGRYRPAFQRMMHDLSTGESDQWTGRRVGPPDTWNPNTVKPLLEHYLGMSIKQIDTAYVAYMKQVASGKVITRD